jgi:hypothetical protein
MQGYKIDFPVYGNVLRLLRRKKNIEMLRKGVKKRSAKWYISASWNKYISAEKED